MINITKLNTLTLQGEIWRQVKNYPDYMISNMGRLYSGNKNKICKGLYKRGYHLYELFNESNKGAKHGDRIKASHLVASAFLRWYKPEIHEHIHHINRRRGDDRLINLFPCTATQHRAIHLIYDLLAKNTALLAELLQPIIHCNINLLFNDMKGGDVA